MDDYGKIPRIDELGGVSCGARLLIDYSHCIVS